MDLVTKSVDFLSPLVTGRGFGILRKKSGYFCGYLGLSWIFCGLSDFVDIHVVDFCCLWISTVQLHRIHVNTSFVDIGCVKAAGC